MIGTWDYRYVTEVIDESFLLSKDSLPPLLCMRKQLLNADMSPSNRYRTSLNGYIESIYSYIINKHMNFNNPIKDAVRLLNSHVLDNYGYLTMDDFLRDNFLEVPVIFGQISNLIGIPVTEIGNSAARWGDIKINWEDFNNLTWDKIGWKNV